MSRFIDVENIKISGSTYTDEYGDVLVALSDVRNAIQLTPTANVRENIQGKWAFDDDGYVRCSVCRQKAPILPQYQDEPITSMTKYCPCCGSEMATTDNINKNIKVIRAKTIEEFAEKLKEKAYRHNCRYNGNSYDITAVEIRDIDDVAKLMMEDVDNE